MSQHLPIKNINLNLLIMKSILKNLFGLLLFIPSVYAQKSQIKEALKELKAGNSEQVVVVLSPIEYLISNAPNEDKIHFYYAKGSALMDLSNKNMNASKNLSEAVLAFNDLIQIEKESNKLKYTSEAVKSLEKIKEDLVNAANEDLVVENFTESSENFYQAYLIDKRDTLQLYNAAVCYKKANEIELALNCYEELKAIEYSGNTPVYIAYSKNKLKEEYFTTSEERDNKVQSGSHIRPRLEFSSKKAEICKNIALIYAQRGYKEKAIKAIGQARSYNSQDLSLALVEANLYLETKDYDFFDNLVTVIIESNPNDAELVTSLGVNCQNEQYYDGAEYYYRKAIEMNPKYADAYVNLSALLVGKSIKIADQMNDLGSSASDKKVYAELKKQKEQMVKSVTPYLQKIVSIDPFNSSVKQLMASINTTSNSSFRALASDE
jgi:tetratricopeptide (TPR) repeat protein